MTELLNQKLLASFLVAALSLVARAADPAPISTLKTIPIWTKDLPPEWALWERQVLDQLHVAASEFVDKYTREDGSIIWRDSWPGMDGSDDGYESFYNFPLYYALGGHADIRELSEKLWDGVTGQFTEYGQIHDEFDAHYDWMHHGESYTYFYFFGLSNPSQSQHRNRSKKFAEMYLGDQNPHSNFDPNQMLMRSPLNGSRGPHYENTAEDWVTHRPILANYPLPFDDIPNVRSSQDWNDDERFPHILNAINQRMMRGDVPLNLTSTSLMANAFMHTGDARYRDWVTGYVDAWRQRVRDNEGILPDNVGLSGQVGEYMNGKWWGGYYGWKWPHGLFNQLEATTIGASNAYLLSGDPSVLNLPRSVIDLVASKGKEQGGRFIVPHRHGDDGWYDYRSIPSKYLGQLWCMSRADADWERIERLVDTESWKKLTYRKGKGDSNHVGPWLMFVRGEYEDYPLEILKSCYRETMSRLEKIRQDDTTPDEQDVHHWQKLNPVVLEGLVQLTLGAPNHIYHGGLLHASVRYFDPVKKTTWPSSRRCGARGASHTEWGSTETSQSRSCETAQSSATGRYVWRAPVQAGAAGRDVSLPIRRSEFATICCRIGAWWCRQARDRHGEVRQRSDVRVSLVRQLVLCDTTFSKPNEQECGESTRHPDPPELKKPLV